MACIGLYLRALKCPYAASYNSNVFNETDKSYVRRLVLWLENQKIRQYPVAEREGLRSPDLPSWETAFGAYLTDLSSPVSSGNLPEALQWLCARAVSLEYSDSKEDLNKEVLAAVQETEPATTWTEESLPPFPDLHDAQVLDALREMQRKLGMNENDLATAVNADAIESVADILESQVLPAVSSVARDASSDEATTAPTSPSGPSSAAALLAQFPLGFQTGSTDRDVAATILRLLYLKDLRELQTLVDETLASVQEKTAKSMANAAFGRPARAS